MARARVMVVAELVPYMACPAGCREEVAVLVFTGDRRQARKPGHCALAARVETESVDVRVRRGPTEAHIMDQARVATAPVVDNPGRCERCGLSGGVLVDGVCKRCANGCG